MELWMKKLTEQIVNIVGTDKAVHYQTVILPNIAMDFLQDAQGISSRPYGK